MNAILEIKERRAEIERRFEEQRRQNTIAYHHEYVTAHEALQDAVASLDILYEIGKVASYDSEDCEDCMAEAKKIRKSLKVVTATLEKLARGANV